MNELDNSIIHAFEKIQEAFRFLLWKKAVAYSLSPLQIQLVLLLSFHERLRLTDLARYLQIAKPTLSEAVKTAEAKGFLFKEKMEDQRNFSITLTEPGKELAQWLQEYSDPFQKVLLVLSDAQKEAVQLSLLLLIEEMNNQQLVVADKMCFSCRHYQGDKQKQHYCHLLKQSLVAAELKIFCTDHLGFL